MKTDIDKLHTLASLYETGVVNFPLGCGKTHLLCHDLAGIVNVDGPDIVIVGISYFYRLECLLPMLFDVFDEHEIEYKYVKHQNKIICNIGNIHFKNVFFVLEETVENKTCGIGDYYYMYLD